MNNKHILVTGGAGFIGSHLCEKLVSEKFITHSLDNYSTGSASNHINGVNYIVGDILDIANIDIPIPSIIFHLGEYARVEQSFEDVARVMQTNIVGTQAVLEFSRQHNIKLVYAGSSTKFSDGGLGRNLSPYAWSKANNTDLIINYGDWFNLRYAITYFYNVYGPREISEGNYATLIGLFKQQYDKKLPLTVVAPGTQRRHFTHVSDIVEGLFRVGMEGEGDGYGLGSTDCYSILEVAEMFKTELIMLPERLGNRMSSQLDVSRAKNEFGWHAQRSLKHYVESIITRTN